MVSKADTNKGFLAADWGFCGLLGGTALTVGASIMGGGPISAWLLTKSIGPGVIAGTTLFGYKWAKNAEHGGSQLANYIASNVKSFADTVFMGGVSLSFMSLFCLEHLSIGSRSCSKINLDYFCKANLSEIYLGACWITAAFTAAFVIDYLIRSPKKPSNSMSSADWGLLSGFGGTVATVVETLVTGNPITGSLIGKAICIGATVGTMVFSYQSARKMEKGVYKVTEASKWRAQLWSKTAFAVGLVYFGLGLSSLNFWSIGQSCQEFPEHVYCYHSRPILSLTTGMSFIGTLFSMYYPVQYFFKSMFTSPDEKEE